MRVWWHSAVSCTSISVFFKDWCIFLNSVEKKFCFNIFIGSLYTTYITKQTLYRRFSEPYITCQVPYYYFFDETPFWRLPLMSFSWIGPSYWKHPIPGHLSAPSSVVPLWSPAHHIATIYIGFSEFITLPYKFPPPSYHPTIIRICVTYIIVGEWTFWKHHGPSCWCPLLGSVANFVFLL